MIHQTFRLPLRDVRASNKVARMSRKASVILNRNGFFIGHHILLPVKGYWFAEVAPRSMEAREVALRLVIFMIQRMARVPCDDGENG